MISIQKIVKKVATIGTISLVSSINEPKENGLNKTNAKSVFLYQRIDIEKIYQGVHERRGKSAARYSSKR